MLRVLLRILSTVLLVSVLVARFGFPAILASEISSVRLVELANVERQKRNVSPLKYNEKLERAAFLKAENMLKEQYWAHYGPNKETPWQFILQTGYTYTYAGENLAKGFSTSEGVHDAWMASPTHRDNLLDSQFKEVGIAVVKGKLLGADVYLVVQMFGNTLEGEQVPVEARPYLKITTPENGDILKDGIKDVRGIAKNIDQDGGVTVFLSNKFIGKADSNDDQFTLTLPELSSIGTHTITVKAKGTGEEFISDTITVSVQSGELGKGITDACFSVDQSVTEIAISYSCTTANSITVRINGVEYASTSESPIKIPVSALPAIETPVEFSITLASGDSVTYNTTLANIGVKKAGSRAGIGSVLSVKSGIQIGFLAVTLVFLLYVVDLLRKNQLQEHKHELLSFLVLISVLFVSFNFGVVRI